MDIEHDRLNIEALSSVFRPSIHYARGSFSSGEMQLVRLILSHGFRLHHQALEELGLVSVIAHASAEVDCRVNHHGDDHVIHLDLELIRLAVLMTRGIRDVGGRTVPQMSTRDEVIHLGALADRLIMHTSYRNGNYEAFCRLPKSPASLESISDEAILVEAAIGLSFIFAHELQHATDWTFPERPANDLSSLLGQGLHAMIGTMRHYAMWDLPEPELVYQYCKDHPAAFSRETRADILGAKSAFHLAGDLFKRHPVETLLAVSGVTVTQALLEATANFIRGVDYAPMDIAIRDMLSLGVIFSETVRPEDELRREDILRKVSACLRQRRLFVNELLMVLRTKLLAGPVSRRNRDPNRVLWDWGYRTDRTGMLVCRFNRGVVIDPGLPRA